MKGRDLDKVILRATMAIRDDLPRLAREEAPALATQLDKVLSGAGRAPEDQRRAANRALDILIRHPAAWTELRERVGAQVLASEEMVARFYEPLPGGEGEVAAGTEMVCPVDPTHYRKRLRQKGQVLFCPQHGVKLVPLRQEGNGA
jgi:hypothetical protein